MKKLLFFGDSITDAVRNKESEEFDDKYGVGYVIQIVGQLSKIDPSGYNVVNRGVSGNRIIDLYARIKKDVWNENPDYLTFLCGINDISHEVVLQNGVDIVRYENIYRTMLKETIERLKDTKIVLMEPFVLRGEISEIDFPRYDEIREYAKVVKKLAEEFDLDFIPLQHIFDEMEKKYGKDVFLHDGVHPTVAGSVLIADEWMKWFNKNR